MTVPEESSSLSHAAAGCGVGVAVTVPEESSSLSHVTAGCGVGVAVAVPPHHFLNCCNTDHATTNKQ